MGRMAKTSTISHSSSIIQCNLRTSHVHFHNEYPSVQTHIHVRYVSANRTEYCIKSSLKTGLPARKILNSKIKLTIRLKEIDGILGAL